MPKRGKKYNKTLEKKLDMVVSLRNAIENVKKTSYSKFSGTIELHVKTILTKDKDPKSIKGSVSLPFMESKVARIAVAAPEHVEKTVKEAGADIYSMKDLLEMLKADKVDFDVLLSTPDMMVQLAAFGKTLGPKGLMPNPKNGTVVTADKISDVIGEFKRGKLVFKADATGGIHVPVGKTTFEVDKIVQNVDAMLNAIANTLGKSREACIKKAVLAPTMGPSVTFDLKLTQ